MKRLIGLVLFLAAAAGIGYWVNTHHNGNLYAAWTHVVATARGLVGGASPQGPTASNPAMGVPGAGAPIPGGQAAGGRGRGQGQDAKVAVVTAVAKSEDLPITRASVGWMEPVATVTVRARIDGEMIEQRVKDGQVVKESDVLFRLDDREIQAQIAKDEAMLAKDQATLAKTQADVRRVQELLPRGSATQQQFDVVMADSKVAAANVAGDQAALQADRVKLDYTTIKAPIPGRVGVVRVTPGNLVRANDVGDGLVTITQLKPLRVSFSLPERDLDLLRAALARKEPAPVRAYASGSERPVATGKLFFVDSAVDTLSGTVTAKASFDNEGGQLWPGQYVRIEVDLGVRPKVTTVPLVAVQPGQGGSFTFVVKGDGTVERRQVEVADTRNEVAAVASGIQPGEKVVVEGQQRLRNGSPVVEKDSGDKDQPGRTAQVE
jgi:multidrug efflux system membrane fusion protein